MGQTTQIDPNLHDFEIESLFRAFFSGIIGQKGGPNGGFGDFLRTGAVVQNLEISWILQMIYKYIKYIIHCRNDHKKSLAFLRTIISSLFIAVTPIISSLAFLSTIISSLSRRCAWP